MKEIMIEKIKINDIGKIEEATTETKDKWINREKYKILNKEGGKIINKEEGKEINREKDKGMNKEREDIMTMMKKIKKNKKKLRNK